MSYLMLKKGARRFNEFSKNLIEALGGDMRPYVKEFYNGARDLPEMAEYEKEMTPYEEVRSFDVMDINIIEDVNEITHPNAAVQELRRKSKGWYDTKTGQVNIVLANNRDVDDVKASVGHETIAHKGLRELVGEENYDQFLNETYSHLRDDLKKGVDAAAGRAFIDDTTKNGKRAKSYEQHRRTAVDELFGRLAEKPFDEFSEGERTLWQKLKATVRRLLDKFLGSLKLPKWFELGDNELRYILWRSKKRLERGGDVVEKARDIVKRDELGLTDEARYSMGDAPETFKARQKRAVENKGTVMPGLNDAEVKVVEVPRHAYTGNIKDATRQAIEASRKKYAPNGEPKTLHYNNFGQEFDYAISDNAIGIVLSPKHQGYSVNKGVHLALAEHKPFDPNKENTPKVSIVEKMKNRVMVVDTDMGCELHDRIEDLKELMAAFRRGDIKEAVD